MLAIRLVLLPVFTASFVAAVGAMARGTASSVSGASTTPIRAPAILAFGWRVARENCTSLCSFHYEICDERKSRFCMEPAASMPLLPARLSSCGLLSSVRPCTLLNGKFFYRKTYCCLEPPPSVAVCGETEPAKCVGVVQGIFENKIKLHRVAALAARKIFMGIFYVLGSAPLYIVFV